MTVEAWNSFRTEAISFRGAATLRVPPILIVCGGLARLIHLTRAVANASCAAGRETLVRDAPAHPRPARRQPRPRHARDTRAALIVLVFGLAAFTWIARLGDIRAGLVGLDAPPTGRATGPKADRPGEPSPGVRAQAPADARG